MAYKPFGTKTKQFTEQKRNRRRKRGRLAHAEKVAIATIVDDGSSPKQIEAAAVASGRSEAVVRSVITQAREKLINRATEYVDLHHRAVVQALATNDTDVARKGAEWAIEKISSRTEKGERESIIEKDDSGPSAPTISIGIALGGLPSPTLARTLSPVRE